MPRGPKHPDNEEPLRENINAERGLKRQVDRLRESTAEAQRLLRSRAIRDELRLRGRG